MAILHLFRVKLVTKESRGVLAEFNRAEFISRLIECRPFEEVRKEHYWGVGNVQRICDAGLFFRFGKKAKTQTQEYSEDLGDFIDSEGVRVDSVVCIYSEEHQVLAMEFSSALAQPSTIAKYMQKVLNISKKERGRVRRLFSPDELMFLDNVFVLVSSIPNPHDFLTLIRTAYSVNKFVAQFGRPNVLDAEKMFQRPFSNVLEMSRGTSATAILRSNKDMDREVLESLARAVAASGNVVFALVRRDAGGAKIKIAMDKKAKNIAAIECEEIESDKERLLGKVISEYFAVRKG